MAACGLPVSLPRAIFSSFLIRKNPSVEWCIPGALLPYCAALLIKRGGQLPTRLDAAAEPPQRGAGEPSRLLEWHPSLQLSPFLHVALGWMKQRQLSV